MKCDFGLYGLGLIFVILHLVCCNVSCRFRPNDTEDEDVFSERPVNDLPLHFDIPQYTEWPFDEKEARRRQEETAAQLKVPIDLRLPLKDGPVLDLVMIPTGRYVMGFEGCPTNQPREARISRPFYIGKYEITWRQYAVYPQTKDAHLTTLSLEAANNGKRGELDWAVDTISWDTCNRYCRDVSKSLGCTVRLPCEVEWEFACRAGTTSRFVWGDTPDAKYLGASQPEGDMLRRIERTREVGLLRPNPWGIHDMTGNVGEWVHEEYSSDPWVRTIRGKDYLDELGYSGRFPELRTNPGMLAGFRVVIEIDEPLLSLLGHAPTKTEKAGE